MGLETAGVIVRPHRIGAVSDGRLVSSFVPEIKPAIDNFITIRAGLQRCSQLLNCDDGLSDAVQFCTQSKNAGDRMSALFGLMLLHLSFSNPCRFGANFLARGGALTELEGKARGRNVIIEFPSVQHAIDCYNSPEYQAAAKIRQEVADAEMMIVEGI